MDIIYINLSIHSSGKLTFLQKSRGVPLRSARSLVALVVDISKNMRDIKKLIRTFFVDICLLYNFDLYKNFEIPHICGEKRICLSIFNKKHT